MDVETRPDYLADIYDQYPNGIGERPSDGVPGVRRMNVPGLKNWKDFLKATRKGGPVRDLINKLRDEGKHVGASWSGHSLSGHGSEVILYVASHRKAILGAAGVLAAFAGAAGAIYLTRRSPRKK